MPFVPDKQEGGGGRFVPDASAAEPAAPEPKQRDLPEIFGPAEVARSMFMGAVAPTISNIAGLGSIPLHAMGAIKTEPTDVQARVSQALTPPAPTTMTGKAMMFPFQMLGQGVDWAGKQAESAAEPRVGEYAAKGIGEAVRQLPGFIGIKGASCWRTGARSRANDAERAQAIIAGAHQRQGDDRSENDARRGPVAKRGRSRCSTGAR